MRALIFEITLRLRNRLRLRAWRERDAVRGKWLAASRMGVILGAGFACLLLLQYVPPLAASLTISLTGIQAGPRESWVSMLLFGFFLYFVTTVCLPYLLACGWMPLARFRKRPGSTFPFVSIIIPAFNEEQCMLRSLDAVTRLDYPAFEVIVVNDGSTDYTFSLIEQSRVKCIHLRRNQGKAAALNAGIAKAKGSIIVFSDSDSWLDAMALRHLVQGFSSDEIGAVSGTVAIAWPHGLLKQWQSLEYAFGQFFVKAAQVGSGCSVAICPGPVCAYRKQVLEDIGGFSNRTITEDFDATLAVIKAGHTVHYVPEALAFTNPPSTWAALGRQRLRWFRGHLQTFRLHRDMLLARRFKALGLYWLPIHYLLFGYLCGILELLLLPLVVLLVLLLPDPAAMLLTTGCYFIFAHLLIIFGSALVLVRARQLNGSLLAAAVLIFPYRFFLNWIRLRAVFNEARGKIATWSG